MRTSQQQSEYVFRCFQHGGGWTEMQGGCTTYSLFLQCAGRCTQNFPFTWVSGFPSNTWCLSPAQIRIPNGTSNSLAVIGGLKVMANRHTETNTEHANTQTTLHTYTQPFNGPFSETTRVSRYQIGKTTLDFLKQETVSGSGISWAIYKSAPRSRQITTPAPRL